MVTVTVGVNKHSATDRFCSRSESQVNAKSRQGRTSRYLSFANSVNFLDSPAYIGGPGTCALMPLFEFRSLSGYINDRDIQFRRQPTMSTVVVTLFPTSDAYKSDLSIANEGLKLISACEGVLA